MRFWGFVRSLKFRQFWNLFKVSAVNITRVWPSWKSTRRSVRIASDLYGKWHHKNTEANAFRHALWTYLIAANCRKHFKSKDQSIEWARKLTDLHEDLFPNRPLAREMDLHNNGVGLYLYRHNPHYREEEIVNLIKSRAESSIRIEKLEDLRPVGEDQLVHLENMQLG